MAKQRRAPAATVDRAGEPVFRQSVEAALARLRTRLAEITEEIDEIETTISTLTINITEIGDEVDRTQLIRLTLSGADQFEIEGSERLRVLDENEPYRVNDTTYQAVHFGARNEDPGTFTLPNRSRFRHVSRLTLSLAERATLFGSARLELVEADEPYRVANTAPHSISSGARFDVPGSLTIPTGARMQQMARWSLASADRVTIAGSGRMTVIDEAEPDRVPGTVAHAIARGASPQAPGTTSVPTSTTITVADQIALRGSEQFALQGTSRLRITDTSEPSRASATARVDPVLVGVPVASRVSWVVQDAWQLPITGRLEMPGLISGQLIGRAQLQVLDHLPSQRLTLRGSGAGASY